MAIDRDEIERIRKSVDIATLARGYIPGGIEERRTGEFWGCCPLHAEDTASFRVTRHDGRFYCFGCHAHGDPIDLVRSCEGMTFRQAVERLGGVQNGHYEISAETARRIEERRAARAAAEIPTGEPLPSDTRTLAERGHDMEFLAEDFGLSERQAEWCGEYWEYPTYHADGTPARTRRKFRDKAVAKKKYHFVPPDPRAEPCGYPLQKLDGESGVSLDEVWLVNGEPSVWLCWQEGIPAFCALSEKNFGAMPQLFEAMLSAGVKKLHILFDNDQTGREGTIGASALAVEAGFVLITAEDPKKLPLDCAVVIPHAWTPSAQYAKGYDVCNLYEDETIGGMLFTKMHQVARMARRDIIGEPVQPASAPELDDDWDPGEPPPEEPPAATDNLIEANFVTGEVVKRGRGRPPKDQPVVDGNTVRQPQPKEKQEKPKTRRRAQSMELQFEAAMEWLDEFECVHTSDGDGYIVVKRNNLPVPLAVEGREFNDWLRNAAEHHAMILKKDAQALTVATIAARSRDVDLSREVEMFLRVGGDAETVFIDLGNARRQIVEITAAGWRVVDGSEEDSDPVYFRRSRGTMAMPEPLRCESPEEAAAVWQTFRDILAPGSDENWAKFIAFVLQCFRAPLTPYIGLCVTGQQNSGKTIRTRMFRELIDPHRMGLLSALRKEEDFETVVNATFVVAFENLSFLSGALSDKLCSIATHGQFSGRELHTTKEEYYIQARRPILLNGITDFVQRPDLKRRILFVEVPPFEAGERRSETDLLRKMAEIKPKLLGLFFDAVAAGLAHQNDDDICALDFGEGILDFGRFAAAAEKGGALPWSEEKPGLFYDAYLHNQEMLVAAALAESTMAQAVVSLMEEMDRLGQEKFEAPPRLLFTRLKKLAAWNTMDAEDILHTETPDGSGGHRELFSPSEQRDFLGKTIHELREMLPPTEQQRLEGKAMREIERQGSFKSPVAMGRELSRQASQLRAVGIDIVKPGAKGGDRLNWVVRKSLEGDVFDDE